MKKRIRTVVEGFEGSEFVDVGFDEFGELHEELSALEAGDFEAPGGVVGFLSGVDGEVDICGVGFGNLSDDLARGYPDVSIELDL